MSWQCPFCGHYTVVAGENTILLQTTLFNESADGRVAIVHQAIRCANRSCVRVSLHVSYVQLKCDYPSDDRVRKVIAHWQLIPESSAKPQPDYIPKAIRDDYTEACLIRNKSPKASATLSRRCLQGMIRDYWGVKAGRLCDEIEKIKDKVEPEVWDAIDAVRRIGNIGAHMEKDVNFIIDVEPGEAQALINLIEMLLKEWYVNRYNRQQRLAKVRKIADSKKDTKNSKAMPQPEEILAITDQSGEAVAKKQDNPTAASVAHALINWKSDNPD